MDGGISSLKDGVQELKGGTSEFHEKTSDMDVQVEDKIDEMVSSMSGSDDEIVSFVSDKNTNVDSVQFVIKTAAVRFERIHPFQDGNGRVGRLIMFKECLKYNIVPFIIEDNLKMFYYRGLKEWNNEKGYLTETCLTAQDRYKAYLDYFRIAY